MGTWAEALTPRFPWQVSAVPPRPQTERLNRRSKQGAQSTQEESKELLIRKQMYRQIFYLIDQDHSGTLSLGEIDDFGHFMAGNMWNRAAAEEFVRSRDLNRDGSLDFEEFVTFCEGNLEHIEDPSYASEMCRGFIHIAERGRQARSQMWRMRANRVDQFARWLIPSGFVLFLVVLFSLSADQLESLIDNTVRQVLLTFAGFMPLLVACATYAVYAMMKSILQPPDAKHQENVELWELGDIVVAIPRSQRIHTPQCWAAH